MVCLGWMGWLGGSLDSRLGLVRYLAQLAWSTWDSRKSKQSKATISRAKRCWVTYRKGRRSVGKRYHAVKIHCPIGDPISSLQIPSPKSSRSFASRSPTVQLILQLVGFGVDDGEVESFSLYILTIGHHIHVWIVRQGLK